MIWKIAGALLVLLIVVGAYLFISYRHAIGEAERAWSSIEQGAPPGERMFDPSLVEGLPETAQRYFTHAIAPETPLRSERWSNANAEGIFRLQPFGGIVENEATFDGYTIPAILKVGNHFGADEYLPFFQAEVVSAMYR